MKNGDLCCLGSRSVSVILAMFGIAFSSAALLVYAAGFGIKYKLLTAIQEKENETKMRFEEGELVEDQYEYAIWFYDSLQISCPYVLSTGLTTGVFHLITNIMMLWGIALNHAWMIIPWLVTTMVGLISLTAGMLCIAFYVALSGHLLDALLYTTLYSPLFVIGLYLWLVVHYVYSDIRKETANAVDQGTIENDIPIRNQQQVIQDNDPPPPYSSIQQTKDDK